MTQPHPITKFTGLYNSTNPYGVAPEGALEVADNCVVRALQTLSSRRGHLALQYAAQVNGIGWKDGYMVLLGWDNQARGITGALKALKGTSGDPIATPVMQAALPMFPGRFPFDSPGGAGVFTRFVSAQKALYFQSRYGLTKIERIALGANVTGACTPALQPPGQGFFLGINILLLPTGTVNWLVNGFQVSYRFTICRIGVNSELIESEPSDRIIASNGGVIPALVQLAVSNSYMVPEDAFFRLYRTKQVPNGTDPGDEHFLVAEIFPQAAVDTNGYRVMHVGVSYSDQTPDTALVAPLYTNPFSGGGIQSANTPAPIAGDMTWFKSRLLLLNTTDVERLTIKVIGTGAGGIVDGDTITIAGTKFTFRAAALTQPTDLPLTTAFSVARNIELTARGAADVLNFFYSTKFTTTTPGAPLPSVVFARYVSGGTNDAGQILLQRLVPGADTITVQTSSRNGWDSDYTILTSSSPNAQVAGLAWSAPGQPEAVPLENSAIVGDASSAGQRIIALKEACLIFKEKDGLFRFSDDGSGNNTGIAITLADPTVRLLAPETAQALDNFVLGLCDQGVLVFSEQGQRVDVSYDQVGQELQKLIAAVGLTTLAQVAFAVAYPQEHEYILCLPESSNSTSCTLQYVFNLQTKGWTRWRLPGVVAGAVSPYSGQLVWAYETTSKAPGAAGNVWIERKAFDSTDYQDPGFQIVCPVAGSTAAQMAFAGDLTTGPTAFAVGDLVQQRQASYYLSQRVKAVAYMSGGNQTLVMLDASPTRSWDSSSLLVLKAIQCTPKFLPWTAGEAAVVKRWGGIYLIFRTADLDWVTFQWTSEKAVTAAALEMVSGIAGSVPALLDRFASQPFGSAPFDRRTRDVLVKTTLPKEVASAAMLTLQLTLASACQRWELCAIDAKAEDVTPEPAR